MKKLYLTAVLLISLFILSSCAHKDSVPQDTTNTSPNTAVLSVNDFLNDQENTRYTYVGQGNEYASFTTNVDYIKGNRVQLRSNNGGTEIVKVIENSNGELIQLLARGETYFREDFTQSALLKSTEGANKGEVLLKEPIAIGTTWTLPDNRKRTITNIDVSLSNPEGHYKAVEVTTEGNEGKTVDYYGPNVGLIKTVYQSNGIEVSSMLNKIEKNVPFEQTVRFYYPNVNDEKLYYMDKKLSFNTNDITRQIFEKEFKNSPQANLGKVLGPNAKINSLYLNKDNRVYIDLNKEFVSEMNAGSGYEGMILRSLVNTVGGYYGAAKVYLTIEGNPYVSGHIEKKKGEDFSVNINNCVGLK
ncbi:GerMN domain-containing protein [Desulfitobacterium sp.]|uniref:GerMN domain-containing protein n=1 Tax=Desulfitobacterium sp. TaxID=49981 RepID=UPI002B20366B|nr:GerMN domain-containing protein [Desulfitobacterium sp.]MEA4901386.1 GerMN domain-containing protein [Desulfitobacterium sp.]